MKHAAIYLKQGALLVNAMSKTTDGVWVADRGCLRLGVEGASVEKGNAVLAALERSRTGVPHPTSWTRILEPLLDAAGVKTWDTFVKQSKSVDVDDNGTEFVFTPMRNLGVDDGFVEIKERAIRLSKPASAEDLGAALDSAFAVAQ